MDGDWKKVLADVEQALATGREPEDVQAERHARERERLTESRPNKALKGVDLWIHLNAEPPARFAHVPSQQRLSELDMTPCSCGVVFRDHEWLLTHAGLITVLACSREGR